MGEIKSVKVDNWGVFFLQKLQNFFNKTDYCDLTLQFRDNSQLKVHRLVLSACTDYFNVLEQTCEVVDDAIIMPKGLQADVVVPIVNFMYTGTLEFELKMYNRLLRTAKDMNMTVLLKLLEAHRRTMEMHPQKASGQASPKPRRRVAVVAPPNTSSSAGGRSLIQTNQGGRLAVGVNVNSSQNRNISTSNMVTRVASSGSMPVRQIGSTTFTRIKVENETHETSVPTSASGGYSLIKQAPQQQQPTSPFEQLRKGYNSNKRPAVSTFVSPPAKKPNLEDVKEFAEQQRMRKQIAAEYGDDDYDASNIMDDDTIHNDDDDDEMASSVQTQMSQTASAGVQTVAASSNQQQPSEDPPGTTTIIVKHEGPDKPPTIVVKDSANSKMNHAKIISEVLRQYPHLIKSNKNIKLKIMPNVGGQTQKIIVKKDALEAERQIHSNKGPSDVKISDNQLQQQSAKTLASNILVTRPKTMQQSEISPTGKSNNTETQAATNKSPAASSSSSTTNVPSTAQPQKRRIDSKTMHALIALGAENTEGPWLCLRCGRNGHPISIPSYRGFRRHLINTHKEVIDPALCEHCGWRSAGKRELHFHMQLEHKIKTNLYIFPKCQLCQEMCIDSDGLNRHLIESHPDENKQQCIYCNKIFPEELQLYTHMKTFHKKQALEDGIIDYSDDENQAQPDLPPLLPDEYNKELEQQQKDVSQTKKINILSDISLPIASSIIKTDSFEQQHESTTAEEYLQDQVQDDDNIETKFVAADGSEMILTAEQRKEILSQLNQEHEGSGVVMVLNESRHHQQSDHGAISHDETSQATTATNEEREEEEEEEERVAEDEEQIAEEDQNNDNQIYNEMKSLHSNLEDDSTSQTETGVETTNVETPLHGEDQEELDDAEQEKRDENMEESKESADNLEWAENLISEHDLDDEVSSQTGNENIQIINSEQNEEEIKDDDNKSQDEISKKLKELTGDWSEDDDDMTEEDPTENMLKMKEDGKEEKSSTVGDVEFSKEAKGKGNVMGEMENVNETNEEFDDHAELLASLQSSDRDDSVIDKSNEKLPVVESENIEDDIDKALESLHKENIEDDELNTTVEEKEKISKNESVKEEIKMTIESPKEAVLESSVKESTEEEIKEKHTSAESAVLKDEENPEEKLVKEIETIDEPEASSSTMEVDEETKKNLIDSLLGEQPEPIEDTGIETATEALKLNLEISLDKDHKSEEKDDAAQDESNNDHSKEKLEKYEEYSDITPEKKVNPTDNVSSTVTSDIAESNIKTEVVEASSTIIKKESNLTSEERVKSLISEWGDDEDEEDNLPANL